MPPNLVTDETVQIILLVLESKSRRFELLQLEFDRNAFVQEILAQIPDAATEDVLRRQSYYGICSISGIEMSPDTRLGDSIQRQNEVKIAIPLGLSPKDCAEVAAPILGDEKVQAMLAEAAAEDADEDDGKVGIVPVQKVREKKRPKKVKDGKSSSKKSSSKKSSKSSGEKESSSKKKSSSSKSKSTTPSLGSSAADSENRRSSASRRSGTLSNGNGVYASTSATRSSGRSSSKSKSSSSSAKKSSGNSLMQQLINIFFIPVDDKLMIGEYKVTHVTWFCAFLGFFISILCTDIHLTMPLRPGSRLRTGEFLRKCGYLGMFRGQIPFTCGPELEAIMDDDSFVNVYEVPLFKERKLLYRIVPENSAGMTSEGLYVAEDGTVTIGGKTVLIEAVAKSVMYEAPEMKPWPFLKGMDLSRKRKNLIGGVVYKPVL